jgi:hypothetical protein
MRVDIDICHHVTAQALVVTHELSPERDFDTYLSRRLSPVRPLLSFGRSAKAFPQTRMDEVVYHWWKDNGFKYVLQSNVNHVIARWNVVYKEIELNAIALVK